MAKDNAIEFTEVKYATRKEMGNDLYIQVPDEMWRKVLEYRRTFYNSLNLRNYTGQSFFICLYPTFANKSKQIAGKISKLLNEYNSLGNTNREKEHYHLSMSCECLLNLASFKNIDIDESRIKKLIISENPYDDDEDALLNYYNALQYVEEHHKESIDVDYLAGLYSKVTGNDELTYFYREDDIVDDYSKAMVNRQYTSAPSKVIEPMMENLFYFIANNSLPVVNKAIITYFYILLVKPFRDYNDEIASLLAKTVLAHFGIGALSVILPLENIQGDKKDYLRRIMQEVTNTGDVTYFVSPATFIFDKNIDKASDIIKDYSLDELRHDFYKEDVVEAPKKEEPIPTPAPKEEPKMVEEPVEEEVIEEEEEVEEQPVEEVSSYEEKEEIHGERYEQGSLLEEEEEVEEAPKKIEPAPSPAPKEEPVKKEIKEEKKVEKKPLKEEVEEKDYDDIAFSSIPEKIDEAKAKRLEEHLLELDTRLSKKQAYFYARHCTLGKYYSIEQYKKACKCVYETARKGMEELTIFGYYKKIKVRKKFLYTPVRK